VLAPETAEGREPHGDLLQGHGVHGVEAAGAVGSHRREPALPQHAQVLRHGRLGDPELRLDDDRDAAGGPLAVGMPQNAPQC
jgi:hypothetical protein